MRFGKTIWHSKRNNRPNAEISRFGDPVQYVTRPNYITVMKAVSRGYIEMMKHGEDLENTWTMIANCRAFEGVFKEGDLVWVDGEIPVDAIEQKYGNGSSATCVVDNVSEVNQTISITLKRNDNQVKE